MLIRKCIYAVAKFSTVHTSRVAKNEDYSKWYLQVIKKADMIEYYDVPGCYILRPWAYSIWEHIQAFFDAEIKKMGVKNCYFPMFVSASALRCEKEHISNFAPEVAWVTKAGSSDMSEPIAIRPTSETAMYPSFAKWIQSHRDLPLKLNQWCNVVRWEFKHPTPLLRSREFLWQEGHTAHRTQAEAETEVFNILDLYARVYTYLLAIPVVKGKKSEKEKFAGANFTTTVEAYVEVNGRGIQGATSHYLGQNFSKMFRIGLENPDKAGEKMFVFQNSWGLSTRTIGAMVMIHGDDLGLVLPPRVASIQVIVIPVGIKVNTTNEDKIKILNAVNDIATKLRKANIRAESDLNEDNTPGWKFNHWELKGVPIRVEVGPRDLAKNQVVAVLRFSREKRSVDLSENFSRTIANILDEIHNGMYQKVLQVRDTHKKICLDWAKFVPLLDEKNILLSPFCGEPACETRIRHHSQQDGTKGVEKGTSRMGAKTLCIPLEQPTDEIPKKCIHPECTKPAKFFALFGRSY